MCRQQPTNADKEAYEQLKSNPPSAQTHPNTFAWFVLVGRFTDAVRNSWTAGQQAAPAKAAKQPVKKEEPKKEEPAKKEEDEMDLFGDDDEVSFYYLIGRSGLNLFNINLGSSKGSRRA